MRIVVPSHLRANKVTTHRFVDDPILCVPKAQLDEYKEHNDFEIIAHPDSVIGISPKRQWIYEKFGDVFFLDDDLAQVQRLYLPSDHKKPPLKKKEITAWINDLYEMAKELNIKVFGFETHSFLKFKPHKPIILNSILDNACMGVLKDKNLYFPDIQKLLMEESFFIGINAHYNRIASIKDCRITFLSKDNGKGAGGCSDIRNDDTVNMSSLELKKTFGNSVKIKEYKGKLEAKLNIPF